MRAHALLSRTSLIASAIISLTAVPAFAQDSAGTTASEDEGAIVVTARRREENLVDVPIAISAISGDQLAAKGAMDITAKDSGCRGAGGRFAAWISTAGRS